MFLTVNHQRVHVINTFDDALAQRVVFIPWPDMPAENILPQSFQEKLVNRPKARQALVAKMVKAATKFREKGDPPALIGKVKEVTRERREMSVGMLGLWLRENLTLTGDKRDRTFTTAVHTSAVEALGWDDVAPRDRIAREMRKAVPELGNTKTAGAQRYYEGLKFGVQEPESLCARCGMGFYPPAEQPDATVCPSCAPPSSGTGQAPAQPGQQSMGLDTGPDIRHMIYGSFEQQAAEFRRSIAEERSTCRHKVPCLCDQRERMRAVYPDNRFVACVLFSCEYAMLNLDVKALGHWLALLESTMKASIDQKSLDPTSTWHELFAELRAKLHNALTKAKAAKQQQAMEPARSIEPGLAEKGV